jgi:hypothetical protein
MVGIAVFLSSTAFAGSNPHVTLVLHAHSSHSGACTTAPNQPDCRPDGVQPRVDINPDENIRVFFYLSNVANVASLDCAWDWTDSWLIDPSGTGVTYNACTTNTISFSTPQNPGGPQAGRLITAFDCLTGSFHRIGHMDFAAGPDGCLEFVEVQDAFGTHVVDCQGARDELSPGSPNPGEDRLGRICVSQGGLNACYPQLSVEPATWGAIKETYSR